jgi:uncharacterized protein YraI
VIENSTVLHILGRDPSGNWYQIAFESGDGGIGWVTSEYVSVPDGQPIPVVGANGPAPLAAAREQINVRAGPGTRFETLGMLNPRDVVTLTGRDISGAWIRIRLTGAPEGIGWVAASFLEAAAVDELPVIGDDGQVLGTSTPMGVAPAPTPAIAAARQDGDSADAPAVDVEFTPLGIGSVIYTSDVSAQEGDLKDWIRFAPYDPTLKITLMCAGNGDLLLELALAGEGSGPTQRLECGTTSDLVLEARGAYSILISVAPEPGRDVYARYTLSIQDAP